MKRLDQSGALTLPLILSLAIGVMVSAGAWGLLRHWRHLVEDQLRLDHCVAQKAVELKATLQALSASNFRMEATRTAALPFIAVPEALPPFTAELEIELGIQEALRAKWELERLKWLVPGGCGGATDFTLAMPDLAWTREPPDVIGPYPFEWEKTDFRIEVRDLQRAAAAQVAQTGGILGNWKARWQVPGRGIRASFR